MYGTSCNETSRAISSPGLYSSSLGDVCLSRITIKVGQVLERDSIESTWANYKLPDLRDMLFESLGNGVNLLIDVLDIRIDVLLVSHPGLSRICVARLSLGGLAWSCKAWLLYKGSWR